METRSHKLPRQLKCKRGDEGKGREVVPSTRLSSAEVEYMEIYFSLVTTIWSFQVSVSDLLLREQQLPNQYC